MIMKIGICMTLHK